MPESLPDDWSISELTDAYRRGELSPVTVTVDQLADIAERDDEIHAYQLVTADEARAQARESERAYAAGSPRGEQGPDRLG